MTMSMTLWRAGRSGMLMALLCGASGCETDQPTAPGPDTPAVLVGAGDIAVCGSDADEATALVLDTIAGMVFTTGDNAYEDGTAQEFTDCYHPTWGRHRSRTRPSPGNHDYHTSGAAGYYGYFGMSAGDPAEGYYSYDLGAWHIVAINSNIDLSASSPQLQWLVADLAANPTVCAAAYWHHPRFSSGMHGDDAGMQALWQVLYDAGVDLVLNGHDHDYERFAPQTPTGALDTQRGIREFVVGTGGRSLRNFATVAANSEIRNSDTHGVVKLSLYESRYEWEFVPVAGQAFRDSGSTDCHQ
ncbi:MAG: alkaline phosphatase [Gemmatimonadales bacterium]|nr:MAG: alkaline phosphatase [Gemmatimonadales bacterium]